MIVSNIKNKKTADEARSIEQNIVLYSIFKNGLLPIYNFMELSIFMKVSNMCDGDSKRDLNLVLLSESLFL